MWVSDCYFAPIEHIFHLCHGENKLHSIKMMSACTRPTQKPEKQQIPIIVFSFEPATARTHGLHIWGVHAGHYTAVALFTNILTMQNCRKCKTKIKKSFTKILTINLSAKIVLTLRIKLPCPKCKMLIVREILVLSFIVSDKNRKKRWTMYWRFDLKIREQFIVSAFSLTVWQT